MFPTGPTFLGNRSAGSNRHEYRRGGPAAASQLASAVAGSNVKAWKHGNTNVNSGD